MWHRLVAVVSSCNENGRLLARRHNRAELTYWRRSSGRRQLCTLLSAQPLVTSLVWFLICCTCIFTTDKKLVVPVGQCIETTLGVFVEHRQSKASILRQLEFPQEFVGNFAGNPTNLPWRVVDTVGPVVSRSCALFWTVSQSFSVLYIIVIWSSLFVGSHPQGSHSHGSWEVPKFELGFFQDLKSPEIGQRCWKYWKSPEFG